MKSLKFSFFRKAKSILATAFPAVLLTCSLTLKGQAPFTNNLMHSLWNKNAKAGFAPEKPLLLKSVFSETHRKAKVFSSMPAPGRNDGPLPPDNAWRWGFSSGVNFSKITDIKPVIVGLNTAAVTKENYKRGFVGSVFLFKRFEDSYVAFQPELQYSCQGGDFDYKDSDTIAPLTSKMRFNYQYINFLPLIKIYPFFQSQGFAAGIHFGLAPQLGFNVTHSKIRYTSAPDPTFDLDISAALGRMLKGRTDVQAVFELGYDYFWEDKDVCFSVNGRYNVGIKDMIETQANGFGFPEIDGPGFMEVDNFSRHFQVTLGVSFLLVQQ